jgi:nucleotide-binding universal stress UspA family protein
VTSRQRAMSLDEFEALFREVSNWGRWGSDDQRGALNLVTPDKVRAAAGLVRDGVTVNLSWPLPTEGDVENYRPVVHLMTRAGDLAEESASSGDYVAIMPHGYAISHLDALCHFFWKGQMYNGHPARLVTSTGARANSVEAAQDGIITRGVLLDIPRLRGVDFLEPGEMILSDELEAAERAAGLARMLGMQAEGLVVAEDPEISVAETLLRIARERDAAALVVGSHRHGPILGSVSRGVVRDATCPVLVVREPPD